MSSIFNRYLLRETMRNFFSVTIVLMLILLGDQFARGLARAAADRIPREAVLQLMGLTTIQHLSLLVPAAFFFAVMLAMGRLHRDSEMAALNACGIGPTQVLRPLMWAAALVATALAWLSFDVTPWAAGKALEIRQEGQRQLQLAALDPGRFRSAMGGRLVFYARDREPSGQLSGIFIQQRNEETVEVVTAARADQRLALDRDENYLVLYDGIRYSGRPGSAQFRTARFEEHGIPLPVPGRSDPARKREQMPTLSLIGTGQPADRAELHWRLSAPLSLLILTILAVPLGRAPPRSGRYGRMGLAIMVFIFYSNALGLGRTLVENGQIAGWLGLWWIHALIGGVGLVIVYAQSRGTRLLYRRSRPA